MIIIKSSIDLQKHLDPYRQSGHTISFIPTMGALHEGHLALMREARQPGAVVVCSIFVNPTQFNDPRDFEKYPVTLEHDILLLEPGTDILFLPSVHELYPTGTDNLEKYDLGYLETVLEGSFRPGHFQGVCQVMCRLLRIVQPVKLFMGQKDYQQCMVVKKLIQLLDMKTILIPCPTVREKDGLAMSSRNLRLNAEERKNATAIYESLVYIKEHLRPGDLSIIKTNAATNLLQHHFRVNYVEIADAETLELLNNWDGRRPLVALIAAYQNDVRLIDNMLLHT